MVQPQGGILRNLIQLDSRYAAVRIEANGLDVRPVRDPGQQQRRFDNPEQ